ncbi:TonB-dependent receptor [Lutibacter citreus]|uniref:TonB-dependent receptor n=1 Tax=Lutibacter citreus TaxID=2138210 RepID=UPI000DBE9E8F|nr:Plug domain-containing protein [Lutibacter citreus]
MIKKTYLLIAILTCQLAAFGQNKTPNTKPSILEKVYLHTDRSYYNLGESLWYKAYVTDVKDNKLINHSNLLYVELVASDSTIVTKNTTFINNGLGHGDFILNDSIGVSAGTYQLRAYTNWMRNFKDNFVFKKEIEIIDLNEKKKIAETSTTEAKKKSKSNIEIPIIKQYKSIDLQFFPEGGSLVSNVPSSIAFKATDSNGFPIKTEGSIFDDDNNKVASFKSIHDGMGKFKFIPFKDKTYYAETTDLNGEKITIKLPTVLNSGFTLGISKLDEKLIGSIKTNQETLNNKPSTTFKIELSIRGEVYFEGAITATKLSSAFLLPTKDIPTGIAQITIYDEQGKPHGQRLVFIEEQNNNFQVNLNTNKGVYKTKEKVNIDISTKTTDGAVIPSSFSIAVTDSNNLDAGSNNGMNISSYFLMQSDIKGKVHNPGYYFNDSNADRFQNLDLLLLTQGWRDFLWKKNNSLYSKEFFNVEKGFSISGKVKRLFSSTIKENNDVYLYYVNQGKSNLKFDKTDSLGRFKFNNLLLIGKTGVRLNVKDKKHKNKGMIVLDSATVAPLPIDFKNLKPITQEKSKTEIIKENIFKKFINFNVPMDNRLDEILIIGKKKEEEDQNDFGFSDHRYVASKEDANFSSIYDLIQFSIPGTVIANDTISFSRNNGAPALIIVDEMETESTDVSVIPPSSVARIEALIGANAAGFGPRGVNGVILIYTKDGKGIPTEKRKFHTITKIIDGFYNARNFYSPNYDVKKEKAWDETADIRNTLYWNPYVHPDANGNVSISYFNSEVKTTVNISLEGITQNGIPIVIKKNYLVE